MNGSTPIIGDEVADLLLDQETVEPGHPGSGDPLPNRPGKIGVERQVAPQGGLELVGARSEVPGAGIQKPGCR